MSKLSEKVLRGFRSDMACESLAREVETAERERDEARERCKSLEYSLEEAERGGKYYVKARVYGTIACEFRKTLQAFSDRGEALAKAALEWRYSESNGVPMSAIETMGELLDAATERDALKAKLVHVEGMVAAVFRDYQIESDESLREVVARLAEAAERRTLELEECRAKLAEAEREVEGAESMREDALRQLEMAREVARLGRIEAENGRKSAKRYQGERDEAKAIAGDLRSRLTACEKVVESARQWAEQDSLYHRHSGSGRKADVLDALRALDVADLTEEPITRAERAAREKAESRAEAAEAKLAALSALIHTESGLDDHRYSPEQMVKEMAARWQGASDDCEAAERVVEAAVRWRNARAACLGIRDAADALASATWVWEAHSPVGVAATAEGPGPGPLCAQCGAPIGYCRDVCGRERQLSVSNGQTPEPAGTTATEEWTTNDDLNADACEGIAGATPATLSDLDALEERIVERVARACVRAAGPSGEYEWFDKLAGELRRKP